MKRVRVLRKAYTPRHTLLRLNGVVEFKLRDLTYLHIGSGKAPLATPEDLTNRVASAETLEDLLKDLSEGYAGTPECVETLKYGGKVCVPGSSLKGAIRSRLELLSSNGTLSESCFRIEKSRALVKPLPRGVHGWRHTHIWWDAPSEDRGPPCNPAATRNYSLCIICDIFGAPGVSSRVSFGNACVTNHVATEVRTLDNGECLELIPPNATLKGEFSFTNLATDELGLVLLGMGAGLDGGFKEILIGKSKYRMHTLSNGKRIELGRVKFSVNRVLLRKYYGVRNEELPKLSDVLSKCREEDNNIVCEGEATAALVSALVKEAVSKHNVFNKALSFSEASRKKSLR